MSSGRGSWRGHSPRRVVVAVVTGLAAVAIGCAEVGTAPDVPASIEFAPFPSPAVVVGDTLRDAITGAVAPIRAIVRNLAGAPIDSANTTYLYADANRDTALKVDGASGIVVGRMAVSTDTRVAARVGATLQVLRTLLVTTRPDTLDGSAVAALLTTTLPDTGRARAQLNTSTALTATVKHREGSTLTAVHGWVVRFELVAPANPTNDTTRAAYLVNDAGTASVIDTTDAQGTAGRRVRVRASAFPTTGTDTIVVRASATYKGRAIPGTGVLLKAPVRRGAG